MLMSVLELDREPNLCILSRGRRVAQRIDLLINTHEGHR